MSSQSTTPPRPVPRVPYADRINFILVRDMGGASFSAPDMVDKVKANMESTKASPTKLTESSVYNHIGNLHGAGLLKKRPGTERYKPEPPFEEALIRAKEEDHLEDTPTKSLTRFLTGVVGRVPNQTKRVLRGRLDEAQEENDRLRGENNGLRQGRAGQGHSDPDATLVNIDLDDIPEEAEPEWLAGAGPSTSGSSYVGAGSQRAMAPLSRMPSFRLGTPPRNDGSQSLPTPQSNPQRQPLSRGGSMYQSFSGPNMDPVDLPPSPSPAPRLARTATASRIGRQDSLGEVDHFAIMRESMNALEAQRTRQAARDQGQRNRIEELETQNEELKKRLDICQSERENLEARHAQDTRAYQKVLQRQSEFALEKERLEKELEDAHARNTEQEHELQEARGTIDYLKDTLVNLPQRIAQSAYAAAASVVIGI